MRGGEGGEEMGGEEMGGEGDGKGGQENVFPNDCGFHVLLIPVQGYLY